MRRHFRHLPPDEAREARGVIGRVCSISTYAKLANLRLDAITTDVVGGFVAHRQSQRQERRNGKSLEVSTVNRHLATLRRMFHLAQDWGKVFTLLPKVRMLPGENQPERVLSSGDEERYVEAATAQGQEIEEAYQWALQGIRATKRNEQPHKPDAFLLRDVTTILLDCGLRPEEVFRLKPENIRDGAIWIYRGKRKGSRRRVRMTERVWNMLEMRLAQVSGNGWLFPADTGVAT